MPEKQKDWIISVKMSSKDCPFKVPSPPEIINGKYENFGEVRCEHKRCYAMICNNDRNELCPLKYETEYHMNPKNQVDINDV